MATANIRLLCFLGLILHFIPSIAQTPDFKKLSGLVRQAALESVAFTRRTSSSRSITAFVKTDSHQRDDMLAKHGCIQHAHWGNIAIATIPLNQLATLSREPSVLRIEAGSHAALCVDTAAKITRGQSPCEVHLQRYRCGSRPLRIPLLSNRNVQVWTHHELHSRVLTQFHFTSLCNNFNSHNSISF